MPELEPDCCPDCELPASGMDDCEELLASGVEGEELWLPTLELDPLCELWSWGEEASGVEELLCGTVAEGVAAPVVLCESEGAPTELPLGEVALGVC